MKIKLLNAIAFAALIAVSGLASAAGLLDHSYRPLAGKAPVNLNKTYGGQVVLVVNTASKCGFTPQYDGWSLAKKKPAGICRAGFVQRLWQEPAARRRSRSSAFPRCQFTMFEKGK